MGLQEHITNKIKHKLNEGIWPKAKLSDRFQFLLAPELKKNFKGIFYVVGYDLYHNKKMIMKIDRNEDSVNSIVAHVSRNRNISKNESKFKVGDTVIVTRKDGKEYTGKVEKLNPLKLRTSPSDTMVIPNTYIKDIVVNESVNEEVKLSLVDPNTNKFIKTLSLDRTYKEAETEVETLNRRLSSSQKTKGLYWKVTSIGESVNEISVRAGLKLRTYLNGKSDIVDYELVKPNYYNAVKGGKTNLFKVINSTHSKIKVGSTEDFSTDDVKAQLKAGVMTVLKESITENLDNYSKDAITDMIINLSRYEGNEALIADLKKILKQRTLGKLKKEQSVNESTNKPMMSKSGKDIFVDTTFVQLSNKFGTLEHIWMGDFVVKMKEGEVEFRRVNAQFDGFSGRAHKLSGDPKVIASLIKNMKPTIVKESVNENLDNYSKDAITDMIINLSRYEGNDKLIADLKKILKQRTLGKLKKEQSVNETINEVFKHIISIETPTQVLSKPIAAQIRALAKKGVRSKEIGLKMGFTGNEKLVTDRFQQVKNKIYFELDEVVNEDKSFFSKLKKGDVVVGKFPPFTEFVVIGTDGKKMATVKNIKTGKTSEIYSTNNFKIKESVNEQKVYIDYLNKKKGFKQDRIKFNSYDDAVKWAKKNFDKFSPDMIKYESVNEEVEQLDEKLITFSNRASYGQVVFVAGGAGSGKGFAISNFVDSGSFKVRDVDEMKKQVALLDKVGKFSIKEWYDKFSKNLKEKELAHVNMVVDRYNAKNKTIHAMASNMKDADNVSALHYIVDAMGMKEKWVANMLAGKTNPDTLPNILFDITAKNIKSVNEVLPDLINAGYDPKNIHLIWVLTNYNIAVKNNQGRDRIVPSDILLETHEGAAKTIWDMLTGSLPSQINGRVDVILNNKENTVAWVDEKTGEPIKIQVKGKDEPSIVVRGFLALPIKKQGGGIIPQNQWKSILWHWIVTNIPSTLKTDKGKIISVEKNAI